MIENKRVKCKLISGGWYGNDKPQQETIVCYDIHRKIEHHFNLKGIGEYEEHNEKELKRLTDLINQLLTENRMLKDNENIRNGMEMLFQ